MRWNRYRFHANEDDYRPVIWPPLGPYWCSGYGDGYAILIAYLPSDSLVLHEYWPEASNIEVEGPTAIVFTDRFPRPQWWQGEGEYANQKAKWTGPWGCSSCCMYFEDGMPDSCHVDSPGCTELLKQGK